MHLFFSGIGGTGIGPLALIAKQAGFEVSGSDKQDSSYIEYLRLKGIEDICIGQTSAEITETHRSKPIDWFVYSSALPRENPQHPELLFVKENNIKHTKRDEFIVELLQKTNQKMIAIAGTHGKTTTTAMTIWMFKQLGLPISYSVGAKLSFGDMGEFNEKSEFFVYEADEYDKNFLSFHPEVAIIPGIAYDHPDIYPTEEEYIEAFKQFVSQSEMIFAHTEDCNKIGIDNIVFNTNLSDFKLLGKVNRENAQLVVEALQSLSNIPHERLVEVINEFPGVSRRFELVSPSVYTDYAHTPEKIRGALQMAQEVAGDNVVVVYEGLHNTRQHFIKSELSDLFDGIKKLYVVPSYLAREDESLEMLTPEKLCGIIQKPDSREPAQLNEDLKLSIQEHVKNNDLVICLTAGGGGSLDDWLRKEFKDRNMR
jgi:UDP-N-acetylmuramate--alanine ligase